MLKAYQIADRRVWVADSFAGLPSIDAQHETFEWRAGDMAVSLETVKDGFARYGLLDEQMQFLKGFFPTRFPPHQLGNSQFLEPTPIFMGQ